MASSRPQPTSLKISRGNPGKRPLNNREPQPSRELPPPPNKLSPAAREVWHSLAPELNRTGVLTKIDINAFTRYCVNVVKWWACHDFLEANGSDLVTRDEEGRVTGVVPYPHTKRMREYEIMLLRYEDSFGMTPSSRTKIHAICTEDEDELEALLAR
jgi:P27 family predicted phage terminase small subunit